MGIIVRDKQVSRFIGETRWGGFCVAIQFEGKRDINLAAPFIDGNKRTAITATGIFLRRNSFSLAASQEELYDFTMKMAEGLAGQAEAEAWLRMHVNPL